MMRKSSLTTQRKLQAMRIQHSHDSKKFKTKKNETSLSPFRKQIILQNKENIHPNLRHENGTIIEQFINNKLNIYSSPDEDEFKGFGGLIGEKTQKNRDPYYILKQQAFNKKISNLSQKEKSQNQTDYLQRKKREISNLIIERGKSKSKEKDGDFSLKKHSLISPTWNNKAKISPNPKKKNQKCEKKKKEKYEPIFIKIVNHENLQKCQLAHKSTNSQMPLSIQETPKAAYLVTCKPSSEIQFVCCEQCAAKYANYPKNILKVPIKEVAHENKFLVQKYLQKLYNRYDNFDKIKESLEICEKNYKKLCDDEYTKHKNHYNKLFQIIQSAMKQSEIMLARYSNEGFQIFNNKIKDTNSKIKQLTDQIQRVKKLTKNMSKNINFDKIKLTSINHLLESDINVEIQLPIFGIKSYDEQILEKFQKFVSQELTIKAFNAEEQMKKMEEISEEVMEQNSEKQTQQEQNKSVNISSNKNNKIDFYCDQILGSQTGSNNFSFQLNDQQQQFKIQPNECILELVEEEDVISPVFKVI